MPPEALVFLKTLAIPAAVAGIATFILQTVPGELAKRFAASLALVGGTLVGYWLLEIGPWQPKSSWQCLPYAVLMTMAVGPVASVRGVSWIERVVLFSLAALVAAWLLIPSRPNLEPARWIYFAVWTPAVVILASLLHPLTNKSRGLLLPVVLGLTLATCAVIIFLGKIASFAQTAGAAAGAMLGITIVSCFLTKTVGGDSCRRLSLDGIALTYAVLTAGLMLIGKTETFADVPTASYALVPFAPLALGIGAIGPLAKLTGWRRWLAHGILPLAILVVAVMLAATA